MLTFSLSLACDSAPTRFYANRMIAYGFMALYRCYEMMTTASQIYFRFLVWLRACDDQTCNEYLVYHSDLLSYIDFCSVLCCAILLVNKDLYGL